MRPIWHKKQQNNEFRMLFSVNDFMYIIAHFQGTWQMFRYSRNNRIVQDALGHHSSSDSTGIFLFQRTSTPVKQIPSSL